MYLDTLPTQTAKLLKRLPLCESIKNFYLSGGTALALQLGHRESEDLDFFCENNFDPLKIQIELEALSKPKEVEVTNGNLNCFLDQVKLQFLHYPYRLLEPIVELDNIKLSSVLDIACTKIITISMRGSKKDFIDLSFLLELYDLPFLFSKIKEKYHGIEYNEPHLLKSLTYFRDAELQPLPRMHKEVSWEKIKTTVVEKVREFKF